MKRTNGYIDAYCESLNRIGLNYKIRHGTYSTSIIHDNGTKKFATNDYSRRLFAASKMVKKDVLQSDFWNDIKDSKFEKNNYDFNKDIKFFTGHDTYNIDISKAYATCLITHGLITSKTFDYIYTLPKEERLICVGMLARSYSEFYYKNGELDDVTFFREETANAFFFLIQEIDSVMKDCKFYLGDNFLFYWVDGIFFKGCTPKSTIKKIENVLNCYGYPYKYEKIDFFDYKYDADNDNIIVNCVKNDEFKEYIWGRDSEKEKILETIKKQRLEKPFKNNKNNEK